LARAVGALAALIPVIAKTTQIPRARTQTLFRRPAGLADGLALKESALPRMNREISPKQLGSPVL